MRRGLRPLSHQDSPSPPQACNWRRKRRCQGFTYIGLLIFIALMGIALAGTGMVWQTNVRREKERELLFVGDQFRRAIGMYYERSPGAKQYPKALADLLLDKRQPSIQRYLRRVYPDPVTGNKEWGIVSDPQGGIVGIFSLSETEPLKRAGFPLKYEEFEGTERYSEWRFVYAPPAPPEQRQQPSLQPEPQPLPLPSQRPAAAAFNS